MKIMPIDPDPIESRRKARAQGMVEFALILPVMLLMIFVIIELARVLHAWLAVENGARFGVRYAVTGEFDPAQCINLYGPGGCVTESQEDGARIPSIKDVARAGAVAILRDDTVTTVGTAGYFKVTVCSSKAAVAYLPSDPDTPTAASCVPIEDAGGPGDRVIVSIDFDHPLITPMISSLWPDLHLNAKREGIVEQFRTARVVGLPATAAGPTSTPTITPTPTSTATPSNTPTPTNTPTPSNTPTPTPTPDCSQIILVKDELKNGKYRVQVKNKNFAPAYLTSAYLDWTIAKNKMKVDKFRFDGSTYWGGDDTTPPTGPISSWAKLNGGGYKAWWVARFKGAPDPLWGTYSVDLVFGFEGIALTCPIHAEITQAQPPTSTPKPTKTPTQTITPGPSPTPKPTKTQGPTNTPGPTATKKPTKSPTATSSGPTATQKPTKTPGPTNTPAPTATSVGPTPTKGWGDG